MCVRDPDTHELTQGVTYLEVLVGDVTHISSVVPGLGVGNHQGVALVLIGSGGQPPERLIQMVLTVPGEGGV